ncbi:MAG: MFS transporter [Leadbetterella sp.]|nr:MFS transporter [Leadbetterella sp.]
MKKPDLSFWQIWNMSFGFLGIQFGFALQNANTSRIFETLGADVDKIGLYWLAAPVTGLLVQPVVGYFSDKTWTRFGRRKPYFMIGALLASLSLFLMPNSPALWVAIGTLWIMDSSINITMEPFRAFVGDNLNENQRPLGFFTQSFFIGLGAVVGSALPYIFSHWIGISNVAEAGQIPDSVRWSFYCGGIVFLLAVLWTVFRSTEYSPEELERFEGKVTDVVTESPVTVRKQLTYGLAFITLGLLSWQLIRINGLDKELLILCGGVAVTGLLFVLTGLLRQNRISNGFTEIITGLLHMPSTMKQLALGPVFYLGSPFLPCGFIPPRRSPGMFSARMILLQKLITMLPTGCL